MQVYVLALKGLSCGHCVKRLQQALQSIAGVEQVEVTLHFAKVKGELVISQLINCVEQAGYEAKEAQPSYILALQGLSCGHCVKNVEKTLQQQGVEVHLVTKTEARIYANEAPEKMIKAIIEAGYEAKLQEVMESSNPKHHLLSEAKINIESSPVLPSEQNPDPQIVENQDQVHLLLQGLSCASCVAKVENALRQVPKVLNVTVSLAQSSAFIQGQPSIEALITAVQQAGYQAELVVDEQLQRKKQQQQTQLEIKQRRWQGMIALLLGASLMIWGMSGGSMLVNDISQPYWLGVGIITLVCMYFCGGHFYQRAWQNLQHGTATMDTLVAMGTGAAWLYSMAIVLKPDFFPVQSRHLYFEASCMILGFINIGKMLESKGKQRSSQALARLLELSPAKVTWISENGEQEIPLADVRQTMLLRVKTGDLVGVDGTLESGEAWLDESSLTGEPLAVFKQAGDKLHAGTILTDGAGILRAEQIGQHTMLANIIKLVRQAQTSKPKLALLADKISGIFVPVVISLAFLAALIWFIWGPQPSFSYALVVFTTVLIIACPCALGLATPMSIIAAVGRAAELGILVRDADALEKSAQADTLVFDKTGTLTAGQATLSEIYCLNGFTQEQVLHWAANLEWGANHPLAQAILSFAQQAQVELLPVEEFQTHKGLGVTGTVAGCSLLLGNQALLINKTAIKDIPLAWVEQQCMQGATVVYLAVQKALEWQLAAAFAIRDELRQDSVNALHQLRTQGYRLIMLTGDQPTTAHAIAQKAGIEEVIAGVLPAGKAELIERLQQQGRKVIMVGDGINDAPALAQADVGIAMGAGADVAIETAEITLMRPNLDSVVDGLNLARASWRNMKQNLLAAFVYNCLGIPVAAGLLFPISGTLLNPMWAGAAMALSSITVVTNANRLLRFKP